MITYLDKIKSPAVVTDGLYKLLKVRYGNFCLGVNNNVKKRLNTVRLVADKGECGNALFHSESHSSGLGFTFKRMANDKSPP